MNQSLGASSKRLLKTIIRPLLFAREHHVAARQPDVGRVAAFLDGGVRERERPLQIAAAAQRDGLGGEQFRLVGKPFQRLVGPQLRLAKFAQLDQHPHLPGPRGGILRIEFQDLGVKPQGLLEISGFKRRSRLVEIIRLVLDQRFFILLRLVFGLVPELKIDKPAHDKNQLNRNAFSESVPTHSIFPTAVIGNRQIGSAAGWPAREVV